MWGGGGGRGVGGGGDEDVLKQHGKLATYLGQDIRPETSCDKRIVIWIR